MNRRLLSLSFAAATGPLALLPTAHAHEFDAATGKMSFSTGARSVSFDDVTAAIGAQFLDAEGNAVASEVVASRRAGEREALEGAGAFSMGGAITVAAFPVADAEALRGRRVEARIYQRARGTRVTPYLSFAPPPGRRFGGSLSFYPTGKATSDGWEEWSTGPIDLPTTSALEGITLYDSQYTDASRMYGFSFDPEAEVVVDAFEIVDLGPAAVTANECTVLNEAETCGDLGSCRYGRCADASIRVGQLPSRALVGDYLRRRAFEFATFEGGRIPREMVPALRTAFAALETEASPRRFWSTLQSAVESLRDGHASAPSQTFASQSGLGVCLHLGVADLLPGSPTLPLVFSRGASDPAEMAVQVGDALVAIDGLAPEAWAAAADRLLSHAADPESRAVALAPNLVHAALESGSTLTFARCAPTPAGTPCTAETVQTFDVDLGALVAPTFSGGTVSFLFPGRGSTTCDYRFSRDVEDTNVTRYSFVASVDFEGVRTLLVNGVPGGLSSSAWTDGVAAAFATPASKYLLDQRLGTGGTFDGVDSVVAPFLAEMDFDTAYVLAPGAAGESAFLDGVVACSRRDPTGGLAGCGGTTLYRPGSMVSTRARAAATAKLAVLNSYDISGNDYTSALLSYRSAETRIFGPGPTSGAFGPVISLPSHLNESSPGSIQIADTIFVANPSSPLEFRTGVGVPPHETVLQRQSDAVQGRDTLLARAREWLNEGEVR